MRREDGSIYYLCNICRDGGFVHPLKEDGRPDYSQAVPCRCRRQGQPDLKQAGLFAENPQESETHE